MSHLLNLIFLVCCVFQNISAQQYYCNGTDTFVKVFDYSPSQGNLIPLYSSPGNAITGECYNRCKSSSDCFGFLVNYGTFSCHRLSYSSEITTATTTTASDVYGYQYSNTSEIHFFERTCLNIAMPSVCGLKRWVFERVPHYELVGFDRVAYIVRTKEECMERCLQEKNFVCRSAEYTYPAQRCVLSHQDRRTQTDSYRATPWQTDYLENQCIDPVPNGQRCPFEEHPNRTNVFKELKITHLSENECHDKCVNQTYFICRAFTYMPDKVSGTGISVCWLHSDDTISAGPRSLKVLSGAVYLERAPCLNLMVLCSEQSINITLQTIEPFKGRIYVTGHSNTCDVEGTGGYITTLTVPMTGSGSLNRCGLMIMKSVGDTNQTLISTVVVIQRNPIIQRRGDRAVKIGCLLDARFSPNLTVNASLSLTGPDNLGEGGSIILNTSSVPPTVRIRIVDHSSGNPDTKETQLGQELEFRIDVSPDDGPFDIMAGHLVATSADGSESILLLDERGCPPEPLTFPAFSKAGPNSKSLIANFRAFKFPRSVVVRFNAMVQFCPGSCPETNCGNGVTAYGRRKRGLASNATSYAEMPLQTALVVHSPQLLPSSLLSASENNGKIIVGLEDSPGSVCVYYGAIIGMVIAWLLLQFLILIGCYIVVRERYRRKMDDENSMQHKLEDDFNGFDNDRHVHWADQGN